MAQILARAPQQFTAEPLRAVLASDYQAAAQSLPVGAAGGGLVPLDGQLADRSDPGRSRRNGGAERRPAQRPSPSCLRRSAWPATRATSCRRATSRSTSRSRSRPARGTRRATVAAAVLARLQPGIVPGAPAGFFDHSQWSFGQPLESSALMAAIQSSSGVDGVDQVLYRRRGAGRHWAPLPDRIRVGAARDPAPRQRPEQARGRLLRVRAEAAT